MSIEQEITEHYVNQATAAQILGLTKSRINILCREGRFQGAFKAGWSWLIPRISVETFTRQKRGRKRKNTNDDRIIMQNALAENNMWQKNSKHE